MGCKTPLGVTEVTKRREYVGLDLRWYFNASSRIAPAVYDTEHRVQVPHFPHGTRCGCFVAVLFEPKL